MQDSESKSLTKQIKRYAQVGGLVGKLATKLASQKYLGFKLDKNKHAAEIRAALGGIKGPLMKVAQLSATIPDLLPDEYARELMHLQSNAPPMGWLFVKRRMAAELSSEWQKNFIKFDKQATRAASLGQVHKAVLPNKKIVACKLQYPDMESAVAADLSQLKIIFSIYQTYNKAIKTDELYKEIKERLKEELDYERERKLMLIFRNIFSNSKFVQVPAAFENISTKRLLTMSWLEGEPILNFKKAKITADFTFAATVEVIALLGLTPVLVDVDPVNFNIDIDAIKRAITPKTKAIVPVRLHRSAGPAQINCRHIAVKHRPPVYFFVPPEARLQHLRGRLKVIPYWW